MKKMMLVALFCAATTVGCGGGSSTLPVLTQPTGPSTIAPASRHIAFDWSGGAHSRASKGSRRSVLDTITGAESIAFGAPTTNDPNDPAVIHGQSQVVVHAQEVDASGSPVPSAAPSFSTGDAAVAVATAVPQPSGTPIAQVVALKAGSTNTTVTFPDGLTGTVQTNAYQTIHPSCPSQPFTRAVVNAAGYRYDATTQKIVEASDPTSADLYVRGADCDQPFTDAAATSEVLHFPYGYQALSDSTPMASEIAVVGFVPTGTTFDLANVQNLPDFLLVATSVPGVYLKVRITGSICSGSVGGPPCSRGLEIDADALASRPGGMFAY